MMSSNNWFQRILTIGNVGPDVEIVQRKLHGQVTGIYDRHTADLVRERQHAQCLLVTGMVDCTTAGAI
jgi:peptidoglycan hydrolase-like protein with peptidoglycan-binding domain